MDEALISTLADLLILTARAWCASPDEAQDLIDAYKATHPEGVFS